MSAELAAVAADHTRVRDLPPEALPTLIGEAEALRAALWARLQATAVTPTASEPTPRSDGRADRLLTAHEAAERLGVSRRWMYRKAGSLPFTRRLSGGTLRFSERGLERWEARK